MDLFESARHLSTILEKNRSVYLKTEPEVPDFTKEASFKIHVFGSNSAVEFEADAKNLGLIIGMFDSTIFDKEKVDRLYVWNIKSLASYFHFCVQKYLNISTSIVDLKIIENFLGIKKTRPENLIEAINRAKVVIKSKGWQTIYKPIHLSLALRVLPSIESSPLLNEESKRCEYPYYEIEGQANGRMNCSKKFLKSYLPHNMGPDIRAVLKPRGYNQRFVYSDFRHCEVTVLQWLSKDNTLAQILESGEDLHKRIYELVTGDKCDTDSKRKQSKKMFLPVMYGCGPTGLATNLSVSESVAQELINRIRKTFPIACEWMKVNQDKAKHGVVYDYFGRPRQFAPNQAYLARDFMIQGVAATICQEKLIVVHRHLENKPTYIAYSVHDGWGLVCPIAAAKDTYIALKEIAESESKLCPGLNMKIEVKFGARLNDMKVLWRN